MRLGPKCAAIRMDVTLPRWLAGSLARWLAPIERNSADHCSL